VALFFVFITMAGQLLLSCIGLLFEGWGWSRGFGSLLVFKSSPNHSWVFEDGVAYLQGRVRVVGIPMTLGDFILGWLLGNV